MSSIKRMEGGRLLGQGTYGCIFQPPLLCKSKQRKPASRVGKITEKEDADTEVRISNHLRKMPLVKNYFILYDPEECAIAEKEQQTDTNLKNCRFLQSESNNIRQIYAPFGGYQTYYRFMTSGSLQPKTFDFILFMEHLLEAGSTLLIAGVSHFDLHPNNLLIDENGVVRLLDFGNAFLAKELTKEKIQNHWKILRFGIEKNAPVDVITNMESPEITIMNAERNKIPYTKGTEYVVTFKRIFRDMEKYLGISKQYAMEELLTFWETNKATKEMNALLLYEHYWPGFDAWAIGCVLLDTLKALLTYPEFYEGEWQQKQTAIYAAIRGLLQPSPNKRMDCIEALVTFDPNSSWIKRFGQHWIEAKEKRWRTQQI